MAIRYLVLRSILRLKTKPNMLPLSLHGRMSWIALCDRFSFMLLLQKLYFLYLLRMAKKFLTFPPEFWHIVHRHVSFSEFLWCASFPLAAYFSPVWYFIFPPLFLTHDSAVILSICQQVEWVGRPQSSSAHIYAPWVFSSYVLVVDMTSEAFNFCIW